MSAVDGPTAAGGWIASVRRGRSAHTFAWGCWPTDRPGSRIDRAEAVADAILYEGYLLYPYQRSSGKNRVRWQFGVLVPPTWAAAHGLVDNGVAGSAESPWQQTECLLEAPDLANVRIRLRFLHLQRKLTERRTADGYRPVDRIEVGGRDPLRPRSPGQPQLSQGQHPRLEY